VISNARAFRRRFPALHRRGARRSCTRAPLMYISPAAGHAAGIARVRVGFVDSES
jgi:hypothetical protein